MFFKTAALTVPQIFTGKKLCWCFFNKAAGLQYILNEKRDSNTSVSCRHAKFSKKTEHFRMTAPGFNLTLNFYDGYISRILMIGLGTTFWFWEDWLAVKRSFLWRLLSSTCFFIQITSKKAKKSTISASRIKANTFKAIITRHFHISVLFVLSK